MTKAKSFPGTSLGYHHPKQWLLLFFPCWARPLTYLQGSLFPCVPEPSFRIFSWLHNQKIRHNMALCLVSSCVPSAVLTQALAVPPGVSPGGLPSVPRALTPIFLLCLLWWLSGLSNSQDDQMHFGDKSPVIAQNHRTSFCLSFQVHLQPGAQLALSLSHCPKQRGSERQ